MSVTGGILAATTIAGSVAQGSMGSNAAKSAAQVQEEAAQQAEQIGQQNQTSAINEENGIWSGDQSNLSPYLNGGGQGLSQLETLLGLNGNTTANGYGSLAQGFQAPTAAQAAQQPGYQFELQQGEGAINNEAAAKGDLISGNTMEAEDQYANNLASTNYNNVYNQAFNTFESNQSNAFNRLDALTQMGQQAGSTLGQLGGQVGSTEGNIYLTGAQQQEQAIEQAAAAQASGIVGSANAWSGAIGGATNGVMGLGNLQMLNQMNPYGGYGSMGGYYGGMGYGSAPASGGGYSGDLDA
jgi:hypothetical protein